MATFDELSTLKPAEYSNIMQGLKRLEYRISKANTPVKLMDAIKLAKILVEQWPLKAKIIWGTVASSHKLLMDAKNNNTLPPEEENSGERTTEYLQSEVTRLKKDNGPHSFGSAMLLQATLAELKKRGVKLSDYEEKFKVTLT